MIKSFFGGRKKEEIEDIVEQIEGVSECLGSEEEHVVSDIELRSYYEKYQEGKTAFKLTYELRKEEVTEETLNQLNLLLLKETSNLIDRVCNSELNSDAAKEFFEFINVEPSEMAYYEFKNYLLLQLNSGSKISIDIISNKLNDSTGYDQKELLQITEVFGTIDTIYRLLGLERNLLNYRNAVIELIPTAKGLLEVKVKNKKYNEIMGMVDDLRKVLDN